MSITRVATCHKRRARIFCPFLSRSRLYSFTSPSSSSHILFLLRPILFPTHHIRVCIDLLSHECSWTLDRASAGALHNLALTAGTRDNGCASCEDRKRGKEDERRPMSCNYASVTGLLPFFFLHFWIWSMRGEVSRWTGLNKHLKQEEGERNNAF